MSQSRIRSRNTEKAGANQKVLVQEVLEVPEVPEVLGVPEAPEELIAEKVEKKGSILEVVPVQFLEETQEAHPEVNEAEEIDPIGNNEARHTPDQEIAEGGAKRAREETEENPEDLIAPPAWSPHQEEEENQAQPVIHSLLS